MGIDGQSLDRTQKPAPLGFTGWRRTKSAPPAVEQKLPEVNRASRWSGEGLIGLLA